MNNVNLIGRLTSDPELRATTNSTTVTSFSIAVDRKFKGADGNKVTDFINIVAWRQTADFICKYFTKGQQIAITGELQMRDYKDKDGNTRRTYEVIANSVDFCGSKADGASRSENKPVNADNGDGFMTIPDNLENDELPWN